jgi:glycerol-3-phosphate dehydrogenase
MITRDPVAATRCEHDLIVVGGGIYGACLALEAARRGLRPLLLERGDFGGATSWNSLRILHGGLRYLQSLDLRRFRESVNERRWFCRTFPELVRPQECLMPLYGEGLKRPSLFGLALFINDLLSRRRNVDVDHTNRIGPGRLLSADEVVSRFPLVDRRGLLGGGVWYDARMISSQRVLIEILHWACSLGATALNYVEATGLVSRAGVIGAVQARDVIDGRAYSFSSRVVCNCAGPWGAQLATQFDRPIPRLFRPSLAFNVLLDRDPPSAATVAVAPKRPRRSRGPVYFLCPAFGRVLAGTVHLPWQRGTDHPQPDVEQIERFLSDVNASIPGLNVRLEHVIRVFAGLLPATESGTATLSVRPVVLDHGDAGGPQGFISVSGVKFTTARLVAEKTLVSLRKYFGPLTVRDDVERPAGTHTIDFDRPVSIRLGTQDAALKRLVSEEAVMTLDDLLYRRTNWGIVERDVATLRQQISDALGWPPDKQGTPAPTHPTAQRFRSAQPHNLRPCAPF